jgi:type I restriction enzyme S subunit
MTENLSIGDLIEALIDYRGKTPPKEADGVPLITAKVIKGGRILNDRREYVSEQTYGSWMRRGLPQAGDILITTEAPLGEVAQVPDSRIALAQRVILLRPDQSKVDRQFFFHFLRSPVAQERLRRRASGTTVSGIRQPELRAVEIALLDRSSQEQVGDILDALDQLIENNRRRIEVLEQMAQAIYREWFVHFRFPGHENTTLIDSPLGRIPEGWEVRPLIAQASVTMGQSPRSEHYNTDGIGQPFHQGVTDFGDYFPIDRKYCSIDGRQAYVGDILVSVRAPVGRLNLSHGDLIVGRGLAALRSNSKRQGLLFAHLKFRTFKEEDSMGGGTIFKAIGKRELENLPLLVAPESIEARADETLAEPVALIRSLTFESRHLTVIRDILLPKLVTGEIDVSELDLEGAVEVRGESGEVHRGGVGRAASVGIVG